VLSTGGPSVAAQRSPHWASATTTSARSRPLSVRTYSNCSVLSEYRRAVHEPGLDEPVDAGCEDVGRDPEPAEVVETRRPAEQRVTDDEARADDLVRA
jgi:hypothetical protein